MKVHPLQLFQPEKIGQLGHGYLTSTAFLSLLPSGYST
jgi:hypothetical protein